MRENRQITLKKYVKGVPSEEDFSFVNGTIPNPDENQFVVQNLYFSLEPAIRGWLEGKANYFEPIDIGGVIRGPTVGRVIKSSNANYKEGDVVFGLHHWEEYSLSDDDTILLEKLNPEPGMPLSYYVGALGGSGVTAYIGLYEIGEMQAGQTVVVSAAAGATGSMVGQIAKQRGCKVIGFVSSQEKADIIVNELGFDHAINYKTVSSIADEVNRLAPNGVDIYFDNVGGNILNEMLLTMKVEAKIVCCGMIADYNRSDNPNPITNLWEVVSRQLTMRGFLVFSFNDKIPAATADITAMIKAGKIKVQEHITEGFENTPKAFVELMSGLTKGKALVKL